MKTQAERDAHWLYEALQLAKQAEAAGEVPVGAVVVKDNQSMASAFNQPIRLHDPTAHAEILALRQAGNKLQNYRLIDCELYVTLEPCPMCAMAMVHARIKRVVFSATDPRTGAATSVFQLLNDARLNHQIVWEQGGLTTDVEQLLKTFFKKKRV